MKTKEINANKRKLSMHCSSKILKRYKRNAIVNDRNRAAGIASVLTDEIPKIRKKFWLLTLYKKWSFLLWIPSVNVTADLEIKTSFFVYCDYPQKFIASISN